MLTKVSMTEWIAAKRHGMLGNMPVAKAREL